ncbi:MAG: site-specific DNA-methyltransferase [Alphaproteobacteria bacterium]
MVLKPDTQTRPRLRIVWTRPGALKPYEGNAKIHSKRQIKLIAASMQAYGNINPIVVDKNNTIIAGHGRLEAAKLLAQTEVPTILADHLTPKQVKAYRIADNRLAELAEWDKSLLAIELKQITIDAPELAISTGFSMGETDLLIESLDEADTDEEPDPADDLPDMEDAEPISKLGDLWLLGEHRLYCGNALDEASYVALMAEKRARLIVTDSPYNVRIQGHVTGKGKVRHREFDMASGEMDFSQFVSFQTTSLGHMKAFSLDGSLHYCFMDWRHMHELMEAGTAVYTELKNLLVWVKSNGGMGSHYRSRHELVFMFKNGTAPHINNVELGRFGRNRTNVWEYPGVNSFGKDRDEALSMHPTVKPVAMIKDAILDSSNRGDIVLDPFLGSGTTLIAAEQSGRRGYGMELDPLYVDTIIRRWEALTGEQAIHSDTGLSFEATARERLSQTEGGDDA